MKHDHCREWLYSVLVSRNVRDDLVLVFTLARAEHHYLWALTFELKCLNNKVIRDVVEVGKSYFEVGQVVSPEYVSLQ